MRFSSKFAKNLTPDEYKKCLALTHFGDSPMADALRKTRKSQDPLARVLSFWDGSRLLSWALYFRSANAYTDRWNYWVYFYTRRSERSKGYGSKLLVHLRKNYPRFRHYAHGWLAHVRQKQRLTSK